MPTTSPSIDSKNDKNKPLLTKTASPKNMVSAEKPAAAPAANTENKGWFSCFSSLFNKKNKALLDLASLDAPMSETPGSTHSSIVVIPKM